MEKIKQWQKRKGVQARKREQHSPKSPTRAFCAWTEEKAQPKKEVKP
jgi:hypothetical protein